MPSNHNVHRDIEVQSSEPAMTLLKIEPLETTFWGKFARNIDHFKALPRRIFDSTILFWLRCVKLS